MISIDTGLQLSTQLIDQYGNLETKIQILNKYADLICTTLKRERTPVVLSQAKGKSGVWIEHDSIMIHEDYIKKNMEWGVERGSSALFGVVARAIAKAGRATTQDHIKDEIGKALYDEKIERGTKKAIINHMGSLMYTIQNIGYLMENLGGVGGGIAASFLSGLNISEAAERLKSDKDDERWMGAWPAIIAETLMPGTVPDELYPTKKIMKAIKNTAGFMIGLYESGVDSLDDREIHGIVSAIPQIFESNPEEDDGGSSGSKSDDGSEEGEQLEEEMKDSLEQISDMKFDDANATIPVEGVVSQFKSRAPVVKAQDLNIKRLTERSPFSEEFKRYLLDERFEETSGHYSGRVGAQTHRLFTDMRMMNKRSKVMDPPDAAVAVMVDQSGSMNSRDTGNGMSRFDFAIEIHDAIISALSELSIDFVSAMYRPYYDGANVFIANKLEDDKPRSIKGHYPSGDNADFEALMWAGQQLDKAGAKTSVVVFIADGQFTSVRPAVIRSYCKDHDLTVVHVDFMNSEYSPFGQHHVHARRKSLSEVGQPIARIIAKALDL